MSCDLTSYDVLRSRSPVSVSGTVVYVSFAAVTVADYTDNDDVDDDNDDYAAAAVAAAVGGGGENDPERWTMTMRTTVYTWTISAYLY